MLGPLNAFGLNGESLRGDLQTPRNVLRFGSRPQQVDILTSILGLEFPQVWANKIVRHIDGVDVKVISRDDLVLSKRAAGRHRDLADLEALGIDLLSPPPAPSASA